MENANNILDFISMTENFDKITTSVKISRTELMLTILKFSDTNMLPLTAINNLMSLINNIFENPVLPESRYDINKLFNFHKAQFHQICPNCYNYLGKSTEIDKEICVMCNLSINASNLSSNTFVILNPAAEISNLIQVHEDYYNYIMDERLNESADIFMMDIIIKSLLIIYLKMKKIDILLQYSILMEHHVLKILKIRYGQY